MKLYLLFESEQDTYCHHVGVYKTKDDAKEAAEAYERKRIDAARADGASEKYLHDAISRIENMIWISEVGKPSVCRSLFDWWIEDIDAA